MAWKSWGLGSQSLLESSVRVGKVGKVGVKKALFCLKKTGVGSVCISQQKLGGGNLNTF